MKGDKEIYKKARGFDKNPQNINRTGANRKLISTINKELSEEGFEIANKQDIVDCYLTLINLPFSKIKEISDINNDDYPMLYKLVSKEMLGKRGMDMLEKLLDRAIHKPQQNIDHTTKGKEITSITRTIIDEPEHSDT